MAVNSFREDEYMENTDKKKILSRLLSYLLDYKLAIAGVLICMGITVGISLVNPLLIEEAIDHYIAQSDFKGLIALGIFALTLNVLFIILVKVRMYSMSVISNKILLKIRQDLYEHIQTLSFSFFDSRPTGKILARIIGDVNSLKDVLTNMVTTLIPEFITVIGVVVIMMVKDWRLALASLSTIPIMIVGIFLVQKISHKRWQIYRKKSSNLNAYVHEDIAGMNVVQSFGAEDETKEIFENLTDEHRNAFVDAVIFADMFGPVIDFCWGIGAMMLYLVGIRFLGFEKVSVGLLVAFGSYINMFWNPIMNLSNFYNNLVTNLTAAERIFDILDTEPDITDADDVEELPEVKGEVTFSHVGFTYDRGTPAETKVLEDVNFVVKPGETIALVGPTGAGKTTIVNLISRFYDIEQGKILIDGYDLTKVSMNSLRRQMGVMTQDNFIFHGTVRDNILYGKLDATDEEVIAAAKAAHVHNFIMQQPGGYDMVLDEETSNISQGQKQLLTIARAILANNKILILDEATSSVDTRTEVRIQKAMDNLMKGRTSFVIAHRLSTIKDADLILVMKDGDIIEQGNHEELLSKKGFYADLYNSQFENKATA